MTIAKHSKKFFGKENLMASFNNWLKETIMGGYEGMPPLPADQEFFWAFDFPIAPEWFPSIATTEIGLFNLGDMAFEKLLGHDQDGDPLFGAVNQTIIEISCSDQDSSTYTSATKKVRNFRDRVVDALSSETIPLRNYHDPVKPKIGVITLDPQSNSINEKFLVDPQNQNLKRYVLIVRVFWIEFLQRTKSKTILSLARVV